MAVTDVLISLTFPKLSPGRHHSPPSVRGLSALRSPGRVTPALPAPARHLPYRPLRVHRLHAVMAPARPRNNRTRQMAGRRRAPGRRRTQPPAQGRGQERDGRQRRRQARHPGSRGGAPTKSSDGDCNSARRMDMDRRGQDSGTGTGHERTRAWGERDRNLFFLK